MSRWAVSLDPQRPALLHAGQGSGWWWPGRPVVADPHRVWILDDRSALPVPLPGVDQVFRDGAAVVAVAGRRSARIVGDTVVYEPHRPWDRPTVGARVWLDEGYVYREVNDHTTAIEALRPGERVAVGPHGALLAGDGAWTRGGLPGRSPRPLERALVPSPVRWADHGRTVAGIDEDERGVVVDLASGRVRDLDGTPVAADTWLRNGVVIRDGTVLRRGVLEASAARQGAWLAGPGGRVWNLATGRPVGRRGVVVALGVTVGTPTGFVTVDWASHRGWTVDHEGVRHDPFRLPLDDDDTVVAGFWEDGAVHLETALGEQLRIVDGRVEAGDREVPPREEPVLVDTPAGPFEASGTAEVGAFRFGWNDDGWLLAWPE